mgnify:CR=1 FL=1
MKNKSFLNVFNIAKAQYLLENCLDYADMSDDHVMVVAYDNTVWVGTLDGVNLRETKLVERIV